MVGQIEHLVKSCVFRCIAVQIIVSGRNQPEIECQWTRSICSIMPRWIRFRLNYRSFAIVTLFINELMLKSSATDTKIRFRYQPISTRLVPLLGGMNHSLFAENRLFVYERCQYKPNIRNQSFRPEAIWPKLMEITVTRFKIQTSQNAIAPTLRWNETD